jgi:hypothetical protein
VSARVAFRPRGAAGAIPFAALGGADDGDWGRVDDGDWLAAGDAADALELLYVTPAEYARAVDGLPPDEVARVVERRRATFAARIPAVALGIVELGARDALAALGTTDGDAATRADLLMALASFTAVPRFSGARRPNLLDSLREGEARVVAELDSPSLRACGDLDPSGAERATRRRFATELGAFMATRGRPDRALALPYFDVERAYLLTPVAPELEAAAHAFHDPVVHAGGGLVMPLPERKIAALAARGVRAEVVFPTRAQLMGAAAAMTPAELENEVRQARGAPDFVAYLRALRIEQAVLRTAVRLLAADDDALVALLAAQLAEEADALGRWLAVGSPPPAPDEAARDLEDTLGVARFLVAMCRQRGTLSQTGNVEALARALSHVAAPPRS